MSRLGTRIVIWLATVPLGLFVLLWVTVEVFFHVVDPLFILVPVWLITGAYGLHFFSQRHRSISLLMVVIIPAVHSLIPMPPDPAVPGVHIVGLVIEGIFLLAGWVGHVAFRRLGAYARAGGDH